MGLMDGVAWLVGGVQTIGRSGRLKEEYSWLMEILISKACFWDLTCLWGEFGLLGLRVWLARIECSYCSD